MQDITRAWRQRLAQTGGLVAALTMLMGISDNNGCAPDPGEEGECTVAADCTGPSDADCVGEWACNAGECVFTCDPAPAGCYSDADCTGDLVCNAAEICLSPPGCQPGAPCPAVCYGHCVEPDPGPVGCYSDGQCGEGQHCSVSDGDCQAPPGCGPGQACPAVCYGECVADGGQGCWSDGDCGYGQRCNTWDYCGMPTDASSDASSERPGAPIACMGQCEPAEAECGSNDDCGPGQICGCAGYPWMADALVACLPQCVPDPNATCDANTPCAPGFVCENGACVEPQKNCWGDADCGPGMQCNTWDYCGWPTDCAGGNCLIACMGVCEPKQGGECQWDGDCGSNQHCEFSCIDVPCDCDPSFGDCACAAACTGTCVDNTGPVHCSSDDECAYNEYCGCAGGPWGGMPNGIMCYMQCMPKAYDCNSGADCESGQCNIEVCEGWGTEPACDPADANCASEKRPAPPAWCYGYCEPPKPKFDCQSDADCASGTCELVICSASAADPMPCQPDESGNCFAPPPPGQCWGYCTDPGPTQCGADGTCPAGFHCGCGFGPWPAADGGEAPSGIACFPICVKDDPTPVCGMDYDCAFGQVCVDGVCQVPSGSCESDLDCKPQDHCQLGPCPLMPCTFDAATGESWCPPCYGQCVPDETTTGCSADDECAAGQYCAIDYCVTACPSCVPGAVCPPCESHCFGSCQDQQWPQECVVDSDCDAGEACACTPNPSCPMCSACFFQCVPDTDPGECQIDSDCAAGQVCNQICAPCAAPQDGIFVDCPCFGVCEDKVEPVIPCDANGACPAGMMCDSCMQDPNCPMCDVCFAGCVAVEPPVSCHSDAECDDGYYCEQGPCPYFMPCSAEFGCPGCGGTCQKKEPTPNPCMVTGCSGQVCANQPVYTTCEYQPQYACYHLASCEANAAGSCAWKGNDAFTACMAQYPNSGGGFFGHTPR